MLITLCDIPYHFLGQNDPNEVQHEYFRQVTTLIQALSSCDANGVINDTIIFLRSRWLNKDATWLFWACDAIGIGITWHQWHCKWNMALMAEPVLAPELAPVIICQIILLSNHPNITYAIMALMAPSASCYYHVYDKN